MKLPELVLTKEQRLAKVRLYKHLDNHAATLSIDKMSIEGMGVVSKTKKLAHWLTDEEFHNWWFEKDTLKTTVKSYAEVAVARLYEIVTTPIESGRDAAVSAKDVMAAAKTLLELAEAFPSKNKEVVFADSRLNKMQDAEVERELEAMKMKLEPKLVEPPK